MVQLKAGDLTLDLVPEIGGSIASFRKAGIDLMRPLSDAACSAKNLLGVASFPMIPYANRIDGNQFTFEGERYTVPPNNGTEPFNVHGSGWTSLWIVADQSADSAMLTLDHHGTDDPYHYRASQTFRLSPEGLTIETTLENTGPRRMPFGFGHHPWFIRDPDVRLRFRATDFWLEAPNGVAGDRITMAPELDFSNSAPLPSGWRNNCYGGWDGIAEIAFPSRGVTLVIEADPIFRYLMLYADPTKDFFCLEPQTNASGALNKAGDLGVVGLGNGERMAGTVSFAVSHT
jgi:aldose 1-epimerase